MSRYSDSQQPAAKFSDITEADFNAYREVQKSSMTNMAAVSTVADLTDLSIPKVKAIMEHYSALAKLFPDVD